MRKYIYTKKIIFSFSFILFAFSAYYLAPKIFSSKTVTNQAEYAKFLVKHDHKTALLETEFTFWQKRLSENKDDLMAKSMLANLFTNRFQVTGNIEDVHSADSLLRIVNRTNKYSTSATYRALASNCILQHKFRQARLYIDSALQLGDNKFSSLLLSSDIALELGEISVAESILKELDQRTYEVMIRMAKIKDHHGKLDEAVSLMEKAFDKIKNTNNEELFSWTLSNLADMYGHQNEFKKSYSTYLKVLEKNPSYYHCLKGIAWLAYSHDRKVKDAEDILNFLLENHPLPDYKLMLAEIEDYKQNANAKKQLIADYQSITNSTLYGDMYNKYNFYIGLENQEELDKSFALAKLEVLNRPTPESYNLLSIAYYKKGNVEEAYNIAKQEVENKCFEPDALANLAIIYKAKGESKKAASFYKDAASSAFELGPIKMEALRKTFKL